MSYSYYLIHGVTLKAAFLLLHKLAGGLQLSGPALFILLLLAFTATLGPSIALYLLVERPFSLIKKAAELPAAR